MSYVFMLQDGNRRAGTVLSANARHSSFSFTTNTEVGPPELVELCFQTRSIWTGVDGSGFSRLL